MTLAAGANYLLDMELTALDNTGQGEVLSNPRVMTSDRQLAHIEQGTQIPYQTVGAANTGPTISFKDAVLLMNVTPQITPQGSVIMDIEVQKDAPGVPVQSGQLGSNVVSISKKNVKTRVQVEDGQTVVLGGVLNPLKVLLPIRFLGLVIFQALVGCLRHQKIERITKQNC